MQTSMAIPNLAFRNFQYEDILFFYSKIGEQIDENSNYTVGII